MARKTEAEVKAEGEWIGLAWAAYVSGEATITALANQFGKSWATMKRALKKHSAARAAELSVFNADAEYIDGLRHDLRRAEQIAREAENPNARVGALKVCVQIREKLAAALGVVTERVALEHTGTMQVQAIPLPVFGPNDPLNHFDAQPEEPESSGDDDPGE